MARSLDDVERDARAASRLLGSEAVEAHAILRPNPAVDVARFELPSARPLDTLSLDGEWLLAGATPAREFSIDHWVRSGPDRPSAMPVDWYREDTDRSGWTRARVPGTVQAALVDAGELPDPLLNDHTHRELVEHGVPVEWPWHFRRTRVEQQEWWYARTFRVPTGWAGRRIRLSFDGVDYAATIYLNGSPLRRHVGMFGGPDVEIGDLVRPDTDNELVVRISPPPRDWHGVLKPSPGWGWHYGHLITMGIWRGVRLELLPDLELQHPMARTAELDGSRAVLRLQVDVVADLIGATVPVRWQVRDAIGAIAAERWTEVVTTGPTTRVETTVDLDEPEVWWPLGYGAQPMYTLTVATDEHEVAVDFGVRTIAMAELPLRDGELNYRWRFTINGRPMFLKGANWCWTDPMARDSSVIDRHLLELCAAGNLQMLRVWGGGPIESDAFYADCDRLGLLVLQEFPLCFGLPDAADADLASIDEQVARIVQRLRNHPSLIMWGGGNENPAPISGDDLLQLVGRRVEHYDSGRPFHRTDPWGGSEHYYGVYHEGEPIEAYGALDPVQFGEYGLSSQSVPSSMARFLDPVLLESWPPPEHGAILQHQAQFSLYDLVKQARYANYGPIDNWRDFIEYSQLAQGEALRFGSELVRARSGERTSGYWFYKVGEVFPGASWAIIDHYGVPKLSYYFAKHFSAPVSILAVSDGLDYAPGETFSARVHVANDRPEALIGVVAHAVLHDARFEVLAERREPLALGADERRELFAVEAIVPAADEPMLLHVRLEDADGQRVADQWYWYNARPRTDAIRALEARPIDDHWHDPIAPQLAVYAEPRPAPLLDLPRTRLEVQTTAEHVIVRNLGGVPAPLVLIDGFPHGPGAVLDDNAFGLLPGEVRRIQYRAPGAIPSLRVRAWNADTADESR